MNYELVVFADQYQLFDIKVKILSDFWPEDTSAIADTVDSRSIIFVVPAEKNYSEAIMLDQTVSGSEHHQFANVHSFM